jgi:Tfp pilus tip-associated adhesin PilY1
MTLVDLDGGGSLDLVVSHDDSDRLSIWLGDGKGGFRRAPAVETGYGAWRVAAADFDGDGTVDLATGTRDHRVQLLLGRGDGSFRRGPALESGRGPWFVTAADLDGDGRADLLALGSEDGTVSAWLQH